MPASPSPRPIWATVGRMSSPGLSGVSTASASPAKEDEKGLRASVATSSPRHFAEYGSSGRCGGIGLCALPGGKTDYDIIRFFTARDIIDLINNLQKSGKIAADEAASIHGGEPANRVKAKCSKVCGLSNRLIDLYVATIKAKVARILRKLGLGLAGGQDLLYSHLMLLQALVDKAFASFNAVQHAEAARIKQGKLSVDGRRENSGTVTWRTPAMPVEKKPAFRPGSVESVPQPAQHLDVKNLLLEARKQFLLMAEELVDLKNKIIVIDRSRIHEAVVAAVAEGDVPDPLPKVKGPPDGIAYGFNTRYVSEGGFRSLPTIGKGIFTQATTEAGVPALAAGLPLSPHHEAITSPTAHSPRTSRLVRATFEVPPTAGASRLVHATFEVPSTAGASASPREMEQKRMHFLSHAGLRSVSLPGDAVGSQSQTPSPDRSPHASDSTPRSRRVISHGGDSDYASSDLLSSRQATARDLFRADNLQGAGQVTVPAFPDGTEGQATCHVTRVSLLRQAFSKGEFDNPSAAGRPSSIAPVLTAASAHDDKPRLDDTFHLAGIGEKCMTDADSIGLDDLEDRTVSPEHEAWSSTSEVLAKQAARVGQQLARLRREKEDGRETLRELALEALRLVERDPLSLDSAMAALDMSRAQLDEASLRCQALDASGTDLQATLRVCLTLLEQQLRSQAVQTASTGALSPNQEVGAPSPQSCPRCGELAVLLDQILPLLKSASTGDRTATVDLGSNGGPSELAPDGSQDEVVLLPLATDIDAVDAGDMANEILATVLQRLSTVLDRLRRLEEESAEMEQTLAQERQIRTDAEAEAARLQADQTEANAALAVTQQLLNESERQLEQLRSQFTDVNHDLEAKSAEIVALQQLLQDNEGNREMAPPSSGMGIFSMNMLNATEMELEGLRIEHENLRAKTELQGAELRRMQNEASALRAARDKLIEELEDMQVLLQQREAASIEDVPLIALKGRSTSDGKAAARAASRGMSGAIGAGSMMDKDRRSSAASADIFLKGSGSHVPGTGVNVGVGQVSPGTLKGKTASSKSLCNSHIPHVLRSQDGGVAPVHSVKRSIPQAAGLAMPGAAAHRSRSSSSAINTPRDHFSALARLEEVQVQLAQAEAARQALECQLQAAQSVIASKDSEIDTANLMLLEYERRSSSAAGSARKHGVKLSASVNVPLLQLPARPFPGLGTSQTDGDLTLGQPVHSNTLDRNQSTPYQDSAAGGNIDLIVRLEELQVQCDELICRAADLDMQRSQAQLDADERAAELQATKEYIQELEEEAELLRELSGKTALQMQEKERDMAAQEKALLEAREALARAQAECDMQVNFVEAQVAHLEQAQGELQAAQAHILELEAQDEVQSRADADVLKRLREEVELLQTQYDASRAALTEANQELAAARATAVAAEHAAAADRDVVECLRAQAFEQESIRLQLEQKLNLAEVLQSNLTAQLAAVTEERQQLVTQLEMAAEEREKMAAKLSSKGAALIETRARLEQCETSCRQLEEQLQVDASERLELEGALAMARAEHEDLQKQVVNDRAMVRELGEKLAETDQARVELAERLEKSVAACQDLEQQLALAQTDCRDREASLVVALQAQMCMKDDLVRAKVAHDVTAAKLATTSAARDSAYCKADAVDAARHELQSQFVTLEARAQSLSDQVRELGQRLKSAQEREAMIQEQASVFAAVRAAEAEEAVETLRAALSDVQARLETVRSEASIQAAKVATLEAKLAQAAVEQERLELAAATAAAHSQMLEEQLRQAKAENALLELDLTAARSEIQEHVARSVCQAGQLAAAYALNVEQEERFGTAVCSLKTQLDVAIVGKAELEQRSACQASALEAEVAAARVVSAQQALDFARQASGFEALLLEARVAVEQQAHVAAARIRALEEQLSEAQVSNSKQVEMHRVHVEELQSKLASTRTALEEHASRTSALVEELENQLAAARLHSVTEAERSSVQVSKLMEKLITARTEMVHQAHITAVHAAHLEEQLMDARSAVEILTERSAADVSNLAAQLDAVRKSGAAEAGKATRRVNELELQLATAQSEHAALADRSASQVAELQACLVAALAENIEQAKQSAAQTADLESQLAAAMAMASEHTAVQTAHLTAQLVAARTEMSQQTKRSSIDAARLVKQLEAAHAEIAVQIERSAAQTAALEQQLVAARAETNELLTRSAAQSAAWEARIAAAQEQHAIEAMASAAEVAKLEKQLAAAQAGIADQLKCSCAKVETLEEQLVAVHAEYTAQSERSALHTHALEAQLAAAQAAVAEQVQRLSSHAANLEAELATAQAEKLELSTGFTVQVEELKAKLSAARAEQDWEANRHAVHVADMEAQLSATRDDTVRHASHANALAAALGEQMVSARADSSAQMEHMRVLEAELHAVLRTLGAAKANQDKHAEDVKQLLEADLERKKQLDLRQSEAQKLKEVALGLQARLGEREAAVANRELELESARDELKSAVAAMGHLQVTVERLQMAASAASAAGLTASSAAAAAADQHETNVALAAREQARLQTLVSNLENAAANQSSVVSGLQAEVAALKAAQDAALDQLDEAHKDKSIQDAVVAELHRELSQHQQASAVATLGATAARLLERKVAVKGLANEKGCLQFECQYAAAQDAARALQGQMKVCFLATEEELPRHECASEAAQQEVGLQRVMLAQADRPLASAKGIMSEAPPQPQASAVETRVLQVLRTVLNEQAAKLRQISCDAQEQDEATAAARVSIQQLLEGQHGASMDLLVELAEKLLSADSDLCDARTRVTELQSQLADATGRVTAAEQAALTADAEKRHVEAQLAAAVADSNGSQAMVQDLTSELDRYREEVERVRKSLVVKQVLLDKQESHRQASEQILHGNQQQCESPSADVDTELQFDAELADDFLEGCTWGMSVGGSCSSSPFLIGGTSAAHVPSQRPGAGCRNEPTRSNVIHQQGLAESDQVDLESCALRLRALGGNVLELMSQGWHGSRLAGLEPSANAEPAAGNVEVPDGAAQGATAQ